ncbi:hypothetical protein TNCV_1521051 [Trichonephila clavipes]|nr:hypothetical protein TNCV_1521051 [Trichonephila clavipes]
MSAVLCRGQGNRLLHSRVWVQILGDKARPHAARCAMNCLASFQTLPWPTRSLFKRALWDMMGRMLHQRAIVDDLAP